MEEKAEQSTMNKIIKKVLIANTFLILLVLLAISVVAYIDNTRKKIVFDGQELPQTALQLLIKESGKTYINIDGLLKLNQMKQYRLNNGSYSTKNTEESYFYIDSIYEAVQFNEKSQEYTKYIKYEYLDRELDKQAQIVLTEEEKKSETKTPKKREKTKMDETILNEEKFTLKNPIKKVNQQKYLSLEDAKYAFNIDIQEKEGGRIINFKTIKYLEQSIAGFLKAENLSLNDNYQNRRSIIDGYISVISSDNKNGIYLKQGNNIVATKYEDIRYAQDTKTAYCIIDKQIGIIDVTTGNRVIDFDNYDIMEVYDSEKGLYKIGKNNKKGIINKLGKKVVPIEYDEIGYDVEDFPTEKNGKVLLDNIIPIRKDNKWGLKRIDSDLPIEPVFEKIGYKKLKYAPKNSNGKILIPQEDIEKIKNKRQKMLEKKRSSENGSSYSYDGLSIEELSRELTEAEALKAGYTSNNSMIFEGEENVLTLPKETGYEGIVVRTQEGKYGIVTKDFDRKTVKVFALAPNEDRIYKVVDNGQEKYYRYQNHNKLKVELKRETRVFNDNQGTNQQNPPSAPIKEQNTNNQINNNQNNSSSNTNTNINNNNNVNKPNTNNNNSNNSNNSNNNSSNNTNNTTQNTAPKPRIPNIN